MPRARRLEDRLRRALPGAGVTFDEQKVKDLAAAILNYRDTEKGGIIRNLDELTQVPGVDRKVVARWSRNAASARSTCGRRKWWDRAPESNYGRRPCWRPGAHWAAC